MLWGIVACCTFNAEKKESDPENRGSRGEFIHELGGSHGIIKSLHGSIWRRISSDIKHRDLDGRIQQDQVTSIQAHGNLQPNPSASGSFRILRRHWSKVKPGRSILKVYWLYPSYLISRCCQSDLLIRFRKG